MNEGSKWYSQGGKYMCALRIECVGDKQNTISIKLEILKWNEVNGCNLMTSLDFLKLEVCINMI